MSTDEGVVILTRTGLEHRYVVDALHDAVGVRAVLIERPPHRSLRARAEIARRRFGVTGATARLARAGLESATGRASTATAAVAAVLGDLPLPDDVPVHEVAGVNSTEARALLERLEPTVICVYGTSIVRDQTLAAARLAALNLHTGISPRYRGADCAFWPLHNREPEWIGATVHRCTSDIDGGAVYTRARATLHESDDEYGVFARAVQAGAAAYAGVVRSVLDGQATAVSQDLGIGTEYRAAMRTWGAERRVRRHVKDGLVRDYVRNRQEQRTNQAVVA